MRQSNWERLNPRSPQGPSSLRQRFLSSPLLTETLETPQQSLKFKLVAFCQAAFTVNARHHDATVNVNIIYRREDSLTCGITQLRLVASYRWKLKPPLLHMCRFLLHLALIYHHDDLILSALSSSPFGLVRIRPFPLLSSNRSNAQRYELAVVVWYPP